MGTGWSSPATRSRPTPRSRTSPSAAGWASTSSSRVARNQRDETVCTGTWTQHRQGVGSEPVQRATRSSSRSRPDPYVTVRYAGASGDFNPIHIDEEFAQQRRAARADPPRAVDDGAGRARPHRRRRRPGELESLSRPVPRDGADGQEIVVNGTVREVDDGIAIVDSEAEQARPADHPQRGVAEIASAELDVRPQGPSGRLPTISLDADRPSGARAAQGRRGVPRGRRARGLQGAVGCDVQWGPSTIRHELASLEELGPARPPAHVGRPRSRPRPATATSSTGCCRAERPRPARCRCRWCAASSTRRCGSRPRRCRRSRTCWRSSPRRRSRPRRSATSRCCCCSRRC